MNKERLFREYENQQKRIAQVVKNRHQLVENFITKRTAFLKKYRLQLSNDTYDHPNLKQNYRQLLMYDRVVDIELKKLAQLQLRVERVFHLPTRHYNTHVFLNTMIKKERKRIQEIVAAFKVLKNKGLPTNLVRHMKFG
jgi:hypothetical protein